MKFAKELESQAEDIPSEWRPYLIQYKTLKKLITKVTEEIESRGLSTGLLHECLDEELPMEEEKSIPKIKYYFTGEPPNVKPNIEFIYDPIEPKVQKVIKKLLDQDPTLKYKRSHENKDFFTITQEKRVLGRRKSSSTVLVKELLELTLEERDRLKSKVDFVEPLTMEEPVEFKSLVIELEQDDEFFKVLLEELKQAQDLQSSSEEKFKTDINQLETRMTKVASPSQKSDMYHWRKIFSIYMDAQIFKGNAESDRSFRSVERSKEQIQWFLSQLQQQRLLPKLRKDSKSTFDLFLALNKDIITIKHYQLLNQTAMRKILKKHDKRSGLTATHTFPEVVSTKELFSTKLTQFLYSTLTSKLITIVPQPDDYACPVCMSVAWRPIRLECQHVFCVRCLIKAQKQKMKSCPLCRHPTAVESATSLNLDEGLQNFLKLYFPNEIKRKKKENEREQAIEDVQAMTGKKYTEEQLLRMSQNSDKCNIM